MRDLNQLAAKKESVPGTAEVPTSAEILVRLREGSSPDIAVDFTETQEIQESSSNRPSMSGPARFGANVSWILRPSIVPATTPPSCGLLLEMGLLKQEAVKQQPIGTVTGGPFRDGELLTGTTSAKIGRVFRPTSSTPIKFTDVTGASGYTNGETITGGTSGATAAISSGTVTYRGYKYQLTDSDFVGASDSKHHATVEFLRGGYQWIGRGCLGEIGMEFKNLLPTVIKSAIKGILQSTSDKAMYNLASYPGDGISEPRFVNASLAIASYSPTDLVEMNLAIPIGLELREDANATTGVRFVDYDRRGSPPILTFEPAMMSKATYDLFASLTGGTTFAVTWMLGTAFQFFADECQLVSVGIGSRRSLATAPIQVRLCGRTNNDFQMWAIG